ncbi:hypothetical protein BD779DRAFT_349073 [Infundibulicybe gibba]|nr:hypothetical protein BD779DRAFT_349073 [Infundibulicybe gibba]
MNSRDGVMTMLKKPPVSRLPPEILGEIFVHCLWFGTWGSFSAHCAPWLLTKVCRSWREVALSTPSLWSKLPFLSWKESWTKDGHLRLLELYLKNSRSAALTIRLELPPNPDNASFLPLVLPHLSQSRYLKIFHHHELPGQGGYINHKHFPLLESLKLICSCSSYTSPCRSVTAGLEGIEFPWAQLTRLAVKIPSSDEALALLKVCPSLKVCRLTPAQRSRIEIPLTLPAPRVVHPCLRTLVIEDGPFTEGLLGCLVAPALSTLEFSQYDITQSRSGVILRSILLSIRNSSAGLTSLTLRVAQTCRRQEILTKVRPILPPQINSKIF